MLLALGIGPGDEVITTPFSFIASSNCILMVGAKPVFVDIDPRSLNMDPTKVEAAITPKTKAIIGVEVFGNPTHMDKLAKIAGAHEIPLIEDCCEGLGGCHKGVPVGGFGRVGVFGFYPNKQITTGEGGMIVTDDDQVASLCRSMRGTRGGTTIPRWERPAPRPGPPVTTTAAAPGSPTNASATTTASTKYPAPWASPRWSGSTTSSPPAARSRRST